MPRLLALVSVLFLLATPAWATMKSVTLAVPGMTCSTCPITIKQALTRVKGVTKVEVSYEKMQAVVTFDDTKTTVAALTKATADAGYPSTVK